MSHKIFNKQSATIIEALAASFLLTSCMNLEEKDALNRAFEILPPSAGSGGAGTAIGKSIDEEAACFSEEYQQPAAEISRSLDLLFVMDTSGSMSDNRAKAAEGISGFVSELPSEVDYRVAVMLAHGSKSSWSGKLFSYQGNQIFDSKVSSVATIESKLKNMVLHAPNDQNGEQGEMGSYSLLKGLSSSNLAASKALGFFRSDAALAVVFVSDENDICAPYAGMANKPGLTNTEKNLRNRDCAGGIATNDVIAQVKAVQGSLPYLFGAVTHVNVGYSDSGGNDSYGYGYMEMISASGGVSTEINDGDYTHGLSNMGKLATSKLHLVLDHALSRTNVDPASIQVLVDGIEVNHSFDAASNEVHLLEGGGAKSNVSVGYCLKAPNPEPSPSPSASPSPTPSSSPTPEPSPSPTNEPETPCTGLDCGVLGN